MAKAVKSFLVIGVGRFGSSVARTLMELGQEVLVIDNDEEHINVIADEVTHAMVADASEERVLMQLGISNFDCIVIALADDLRASVLTTVLCREQGAKKIVAKAYDSIHAKLLLKTGADTVVLPERETGRRLAHSLVHVNVLDYIELSDVYSITEMHVPAEWVNHTLKEIDVRARFKVSIIAIKRDGMLELTLDAGFRLRDDDTLVVLGENANLKKVETL